VPIAATPAAVVAMDPQTRALLEAALAGVHRLPDNRARDVHRHPLETLAFFGLRRDMTVVELWPGGGWYTEIVAPVLAERGQYVVAGSRAKDDQQARLDKNKAIFGKVQVVEVQQDAQYDLGAPGTVDLVMTFRSLHGWLHHTERPYADLVLGAAYRVLKPGGVLGMVAHRGKPGQAPKQGYVEEAQAIALAEAAGFKLAGKSEVNANPKDTKNHPHGVWSLPPSLRGGQQDREMYLTIGESDRMTLKFIKPL
jgi:predicted methyltransferase